MDTERSHAGIEPDALDRAIRSALNVDPSPEFLVRVRARIAEERPARPWTAIFVPVVAAAATLAVLALFAVNTSRRSIPEPAPSTAALTEPAVNRSTPSVDTPEPAPPAAPMRRPAPEPPRRAAAAPRLSDEARGLQALVDTINRGTVIVAGDMQSTGLQPTEIRELEIATLTISSIRVEPIAPVAQ